MRVLNSISLPLVRIFLHSHNSLRVHMLSQHISLNTIDAWVQAVGVIRSSLVTRGGSRVTDSEYGWRVTDHGSRVAISRIIQRTPVTRKCVSSSRPDITVSSHVSL